MAADRALPPTAAESPGKAFRRALFRPSGPAVVIALAVTAAGFLACAFGITRASFVRLHAYFAEDRRDSDVFLSARALALEAEREPSRPAIVLLGGSSLMSVVDPDELGTAVRSATGQDVRAISLMSFGQSLVETASIPDVLPAGLRGEVVVGTSLIEICRSVQAEPKPDDPPVGSRFAFASPTLEEHFRALHFDVPEPTGNYFWDHRHFFLPRLGPFVRNLLWHGPVELNARPWPAMDHQQSEQERREMGERIRVLIQSGYPANADAGTDLLVQSLARLHARGLDVVLVETPLAPLILDQFVGKDFLRRHRERMRALAAEHGLEYASLDQEAGLTDADFYDHTHVYRTPAQQRFTAALAGLLAKRLEASNGAGGG